MSKKSRLKAARIGRPTGRGRFCGSQRTHWLKPVPPWLYGKGRGRGPLVFSSNLVFAVG